MWDGYRWTSYGLYTHKIFMFLYNICTKPNELNGPSHRGEGLYMPHKPEILHIFTEIIILQNLNIFQHFSKLEHRNVKKQYKGHSSMRKFTIVVMPRNIY